MPFNAVGFIHTLIYKDVLAVEFYRGEKMKRCYLSLRISFNMKIEKRDCMLDRTEEKLFPPFCGGKGMTDFETDKETDDGVYL